MDHAIATYRIYFKETSESGTATCLQNHYISGLICNVLVVKSLGVIHLIITYMFLSLQNGSMLFVVVLI